MNAKYPLTKHLTDYIGALRSKLKYNYEEFADLFNHSKTWAYNIANNNMIDIAIEDLWSILLAEYNYRLFLRKQARMKELLQEGISSQYVKPTTLEKMFPKKVPIEIFKQGCCNVPSEFIKAGHTTECNSLFAEDRFPEEDKYICKTFDERHELSKLHKDLIEDFILGELKAIKAIYTVNALKNEYWLFAMELMFKNIHISNTLWERIKFICFDNEYLRQNTEFKWRHIYSVLGENCSLTNKDYYSTANVIYFDNPKAPISEENLPSFNIRYDIDEMITTGNDEDDYFELKLEDGVRGKIKLIDIFMLLYRANYITSTTKDNQFLFRKTCMELLDYGIEMPFSEFNLFPVKKAVEKPIDLEFIASITEFFKQYEDHDKFDTVTNTYELKDRYKNNKGLVQFRKNMLTKTAERFLDVISIDFSFIDKLPSSKDEVLHKELEDVVKEFKKKNLI